MTHCFSYTAEKVDILYKKSGNLLIGGNPVKIQSGNHLAKVEIFLIAPYVSLEIK